MLRNELVYMPLPSNTYKTRKICLSLIEDCSMKRSFIIDLWKHFPGYFGCWTRSSREAPDIVVFLRALGQFLVLSLAILSTLRILRVPHLLPLILRYEAFFISISSVIQIPSYQAMKRTYFKPYEGAPYLMVRFQQICTISTRREVTLSQIRNHYENAKSYATAG